MDKRLKSIESDKITNILRMARLIPKFEESGEDDQTIYEKDRSEEHGIGFLAGFLMLFSNPLLH